MGPEFKPSALRRCVPLLEPRDRHVADGIGARDLDQRLVATRQPRQNLPLLMLRHLRGAPHVDTRRFGAADSVAGSGADQLALEFGDVADDRDLSECGPSKADIRAEHSMLTRTWLTVLSAVGTLCAAHVQRVAGPELTFAPSHAPATSGALV